MTQPAPPRTTDLAFLDGVRGLAAAYVMVGHARWLLWEGFAAMTGSNAAAYDPLQRALGYGLALFRFGHEAVLLFFVLSGLVIHLRYARGLAQRPEEARFDGWSYLRRRARRLYPPLLLALALTFLLDLAGRAAGFSLHRGATPYPLINANVGRDLGPGTLAGNLAFVMDTYVPSFGSNGPLWSLKYEAWFYFSYPLLWLVARGGPLRATAVVVAGAALALSARVPVKLVLHVASLLPVWWLGAILAERLAGRLRIAWRFLAAPALLLPALPFVKAPPLVHDYAWGLGFAGLLALLLALAEAGRPLRPLAALKPLGDCSYTLYATHFPVLVLISGWLMSRSPTGELPSSFAWIPVGVIATLAIAWCAHWFVERPFTTRGASARPPAAEAPAPQLAPPAVP